jgi:hypothetical protein
MTDMQSEVRAPLIQAPIAWVTRRILASSNTIQAVMAVDDAGKVLAHERASDYEDLIDEDFPLLFFAPVPRVLFLLKLSSPSTEEVEKGVRRILTYPAFGLTR